MISLAKLRYFSQYWSSYCDFLRFFAKIIAKLAFFCPLSIILWYDISEFDRTVCKNALIFAFFASTYETIFRLSGQFFQ